MLSDQDIATYRETGYLRIPAVFDADEMGELRTDLDGLLQDWATTSVGWTGPWRQVYMSPDVEQRSMLTHLHDLHLYSAVWCRAVTNERLAGDMAALVGGADGGLPPTKPPLQP